MPVPWRERGTSSGAVSAGCLCLLETPTEGGHEERGDVTDDEADFTLLVIVATGHHGPHRIIHHGHNVGVVVLRTQNGAVTVHSHMGAEITDVQEGTASEPPCSEPALLLQWGAPLLLTAGPQTNRMRVQQFQHRNRTVTFITQIKTLFQAEA